MKEQLNYLEKENIKFKVKLLNLINKSTPIFFRVDDTRLLKMKVIRSRGTQFIEIILEDDKEFTFEAKEELTYLRLTEYEKSHLTPQEWKKIIPEMENP